MDNQSLLTSDSPREASSRTGFSFTLDSPFTADPSGEGSLMNSRSTINSEAETAATDINCDVLVYVIPDEFRDLAAAARSIDDETPCPEGNVKRWPIPLTVVQADYSAGTVVDPYRYTDFIFTFPRLSRYLKERSVTGQLRQILVEGGQTIEKQGGSGLSTWKVTRWSRVGYLQRRIAEGFAPEDLVGELKSVRQFKTASTSCYRYGRLMEEAALLNGFAFGDEGLHRLCAEIHVDEASVHRDLWNDGIQGRFLGVTEDGQLVQWAIRRVGWIMGDDGHWHRLPDDAYQHA